MVSAAITLCSAALLAYWFRYTCSLILQQHLQPPATPPEPGTRTVACSPLSAEWAVGEDLRSILLSLDADYRLLSYLLGQVPTTLPRPVRRMLALHYRVLRLWCGVLSRVAPRRARRTAGEMALVVACFGRALEPAADLDR